MQMDSLETFCLRRREYRLATHYPRAAGRPAERRGRDRGPRGLQADLKGRYSGSTMVVGDAGFEPATPSL